MNIFAISMILALCGNANSADLSRYSVPDEADLGRLQETLKTGHFNVHSVGVINGQKYIFWGKGGETKDPGPLIESALPPDAKKMRQLAKKWSAGTITPEEKDALLKAFVLRSLKIKP